MGFLSLNFLQNPSVDRSLKPVVIVAVGDVALSLGGAAFAPFAPSMCQILVQAGLTKCEEGPPNWQVSLFFMHAGLHPRPRLVQSRQTAGGLFSF